MAVIGVAEDVLHLLNHRVITLLEVLAKAGGEYLHAIAKPLAEDAAFLRKLKPSLMVARAKGEAPTNEKPGEARRAPGAPQLGKRPKPKQQAQQPAVPQR